MHIKFLDHGTGSALDAAKYLLGTHDHLGIERAGVQVLRGDPMAVSAVADSLQFKHKYTSGVIAFAPEDSPTDAQISDVIADFERVSFAGMDPNRVSYSAILHREQGGGCHIHIIAARVDLETGRSMNIAPPGWEKSFDPLRDMHNCRHGWARPDDPARARTLQPGYRALIDAGSLRAGIAIDPDPKSLITRFLEQRIEAGLIADRVGILDSLREAGLEINRQGVDYISVKDTETGQKIRLKGGIYEQSFQPSGSHEITDSARPGGDRRADERGAAAAQRRFEAAIQRRGEYNSQRYQKRDEPSVGHDNERQDPHRAAPSAIAATNLAGHVGSSSGNSSPLRVDFGRDMALPADRFDDRKNGEHSDVERSNGNRHNVARLDDVQDGGRAAPLPNQITNAGGDHDRTRDHADAIAAAIDERIRAAREAAAAAIGHAQRTSQQLERASRQIDRGAAAMKSSADAELEAIKRGVNLVEYAENCGFQIIKNESSKNSVSMKKGDEKIIVATAQDGHGIYFNVRDSRDNGSVIDFAQKQHGLNLGQARKELRPWAGLPTRSPLTVHQRMRKPISLRPQKPVPITRDEAETLAAFHQLQEYRGSYLKGRGIDDETVRAFGDVLRSDGRGNACMIHRDDGGNVSGWEMKNQAFTGFSAGGAKSLFLHSPNPELDRQPRRLVIFESAIDAMSFHQRHGRRGDLYASTGGGMSEKQIKELARIAQEVTDSLMKVLFGFDADAAGDGYAAQLQTSIPRGERIRPQVGKDWNDELRHQARPASPKHRTPRI
jgi:hypothetical protein